MTKVYGLIQLLYVYRLQSIYSFFRPVYFTFYGVATPANHKSALRENGRKPVVELSRTDEGRVAQNRRSKRVLLILTFTVIDNFTLNLLYGIRLGLNLIRQALVTPVSKDGSSGSHPPFYR